MRHLVLVLVLGLELELLTGSSMLDLPVYHNRPSQLWLESLGGQEAWHVGTILICRVGPVVCARLWEAEGHMPCNQAQPCGSLVVCAGGWGEGLCDALTDKPDHAAAPCSVGQYLTWLCSSHQGTQLCQTACTLAAPAEACKLQRWWRVRVQASLNQKRHAPGTPVAAQHSAQTGRTPTLPSTAVIRVSASCKHRRMPLFRAHPRCQTQPQLSALCPVRAPAATAAARSPHRQAHGGS